MQWQGACHARCPEASYPVSDPLRSLALTKMKPPRSGNGAVSIEGDFCIAPTFVQLQKGSSRKGPSPPGTPGSCPRCFDRCLFNQPPHDLAVLRWRPSQDLILGPFKKGLQEDVSFVEDLLAGCSLELDQLSAVLIFDGLYSEFPEPFELLFRCLFLRLQEIAFFFFALSMMCVASALASDKNA